MGDAPLRAALSACGGIADLAIDAARRSDRFDIVAVQDPDAEARERVGERLGVSRRHEEFASLLTDDVDFVIVNGPNDVHLDQVRLAAAAGKPCLVQKPMAPTLADATAMVETARDAGVPLGVVMFELGKPLHHEVRAMVRDGWLGEPVLVEATGAHDIYLRNPPAEGDWRLDPERVGGAAFIQLAVHHVNLARWILGREVESVAATRTGGHTAFADETTLATLAFSGGPLGHFAASYATSLYGFAICGTRGRIHLLPDHVVLRGEAEYRGEILTYDRPGQEDVLPLASLDESIAAGRDAAEVHAAFARHLLDGEEYACTGESALEDMRVVDAVERSVRTGARTALS